MLEIRRRPSPRTRLICSVMRCCRTFWSRTDEVANAGGLPPTRHNHGRPTRTLGGLEVWLKDETQQGSVSFSFIEALDAVLHPPDRRSLPRRQAIMHDPVCPAYR